MYHEPKLTKSLDNFAQWVVRIEFRDSQWHALFYPGKTVIAFSIIGIARSLQQHVMEEIIQLSCEALNVTAEAVRKRTRDRKITDCRMAIANVLLTHFDHTVSYIEMAKALGWVNHATLINARNNAIVDEIRVKINKIYSRFPFLKDNFQTLRT